MKKILFIFAINLAFVNFALANKWSGIFDTIKNKDNILIDLRSYMENNTINSTDIKDCLQLLDNKNFEKMDLAALALGEFGKLNKVTAAEHRLWAKAAQKHIVDYFAPDGSKIRYVNRAGVGKQKNSSSPKAQFDTAYAELGPTKASQAIKHKTITEKWYFILGKGQVFIDGDNSIKPKIIDTKPGTYVEIPVNKRFQFRNTSKTEDLLFYIVCTPPWPGPENAIECDNYWT